MSKYSLKFKNTTQQFWYLAWIGEISHTKKLIKVELFFIKCDYNISSDLKLNYNIFEKVKVPVSYLSSFKIGVIYCVKNKELINPDLSEFNKNTNTFISYGIVKSNETFPLLNNLYFKKIIAHNTIKINYYRLKINENISILITPYSILQYLLFKTDKLVKEILSTEILSCFRFNINSSYIEKESGKKVIELYYDQSKLNHNEASVIAPFLLMKDNLGLKFINSIHSAIFNSFLNNKNSVFPDIYFGFKCFKIGMKTKLYKHENHMFNLANELNYLEIKDYNLFKIDKILLFPFIDKSSTEDRKNHEEIPYFKDQIQIIDDGHIINLQQDSTSSHSPILDQDSQEYFQVPFNIEIEPVNRKTQINAYRAINNSTNDIIEESVRDFNSFQYEEKVIKKNIELILLENYKYFKKITSYLELYPDIKINDNPLKIKGKYPTRIGESLIDIIEINYCERYIYIIEFGEGMIGVFENIEPAQISASLLTILIINFNNTKSNELLWTHIYHKLFNKYRTEFRINIRMGIKHSRKSVKINENDKYVAIQKTAERIYYDRIKRIL